MKTNITKAIQIVTLPKFTLDLSLPGIRKLFFRRRPHLRLRYVIPAFTLAEVLITLGIIGIVAAMTIPTLIANYKEKALESQFKKSYSLINQALMNASSTFGYIPKCYYAYGSFDVTATSECYKLAQEFLASLKVSRTCEDKAYEQGCISEYKGMDDTLKEAHKDDEDYDEDYWQDYATRNCNGFTASEILNNKTVYVLADGTIIFFYRNNSPNIIAFDVNGMSGPNKWGYDIFAMRLRSDGNRFRYEYDGCQPIEKGGKRFDEMYKDVFQ